MSSSATAEFAFSSASSELRRYRVQQQIGSDIETVREAALTRENVDEWPFIKEFRILVETDTESVCYVRSGFPGLKDRDLTVVVNHPPVGADDELARIRFRIDSSSGPAPRRDAIRVTRGEGWLLLRRTSDGETMARFEYEIDPRVRMPRTLKQILLRQAGIMMVALLGHVARLRGRDAKRQIPRFSFAHFLP